MTEPAVNEHPKTPIIIHVGYPKTGTTWLQTRVFSTFPDIDYWPAPTFFEDFKFIARTKAPLYPVTNVRTRRKNYIDPYVKRLQAQGAETIRLDSGILVILDRGK